MHCKFLILKQQYKQAKLKKIYNLQIFKICFSFQGVESDKDGGGGGEL